MALCILDLAGLALQTAELMLINLSTYGVIDLNDDVLLPSAAMQLCSSWSGSEERATASVVASAVGSEVRWDRRRKPTEIAGSACISVVEERRAAPGWTPTTRLRQ